MLEAMKMLHRANNEAWVFWTAVFIYRVRLPE